MVYFHADWCPHCNHFGPQWDQLVGNVSEKMQFPTPTGQSQTATLLKMNCARFRDTCRDLGIKSFPTLRLYKRSGSFVPYTEEHTFDNAISFLKDYFSQRLQERAVSSGGCQVLGDLNIPRVQGNFHLTVGPAQDSTPNPDLVNMTHVVDHLTFNDAQANFRVWERIVGMKAEGVPESFFDHLQPLDAKMFVVQRANHAHQHFLKAVNTKIGKKKNLYQITHTARTLRAEDAEEHAVPRAHFAYDFSPLGVVIQRKRTPWYEFVTSLVAIIGGSYAIVQLFGGAADSVYLARKDAAKQS
jgi:thiol-disulfide isomerase/thioredoxin